MNFYPHHLGDYAKDTKDLTPLEHGCYRLLMDSNYATEQPIPNELDRLYRIVGAVTPAERRAVGKVADRFFAINGDGRRHNKRVEAEIARAKEKSAKAKASAAASVAARGLTPVQLPLSERSNERSASHEPIASESTTSDASHRKPSAAPQGLDCPHDKLLALYHEVLPTCTRMVEWNANRQALMRSRWREKAQPKGKHPGYTTEADGLDFWRRFFGYVQQSDFLTGRASPAAGRKTFVATLEWLLKPANFAKVIEGNYHS